MARLFNAATPDYLRSSSTPVTAAPFTFAAWARSNSNTLSQDIISVGDKDAALHFWSLAMAGSVGGDPVRMNAVAGLTAAVADTSTGYTAGQWHHVACYEASATSRAVFIDGGSKGTNATNRSPANSDNVTIGARANSALNGPFSGDIAECAIWNVALADAEIALLAKGMTPTLMRPESLVFYAPLIGRTSPEIELRGGLSLTITGTPSASAHPRVFYRPGILDARRVFIAATTAVKDLIGGGIIPFAR